MTTRPQSRTTFPLRPFIVMGVITVGVAVGIGVARWDGGDSTTTTTDSAVAPGFAPWIAPGAPSAFEAFQAEMGVHESLTENQFGPLMRGTVLADQVAAALAEHDNAITPGVGTGGGLAASVSAGRTFDEALADALAQHDRDFPPIVESSGPKPPTLPATDSGRTFDSALADAIANDPAFPPVR